MVYSTGSKYQGIFKCNKESRHSSLSQHGFIHMNVSAALTDTVCVGYPNPNR